MISIININCCPSLFQCSSTLFFYFLDPLPFILMPIFLAHPLSLNFQWSPTLDELKAKVPAEFCFALHFLNAIEAGVTWITAVLFITELTHQSVLSNIIKGKIVYRSLLSTALTNPDLLLSLFHGWNIQYFSLLDPKVRSAEPSQAAIGNPDIHNAMWHKRVTQATLETFVKISTLTYSRSTLLLLLFLCLFCLILVSPPIYSFLSCYYPKIPKAIYNTWWISFRIPHLFATDWKTDFLFIYLCLIGYSM